MSIDFYATLGVDRNATTEQIRKRFLMLTREHHPDNYQGQDKAAAELKFQDITQAFNILSNPNRRRAHDAELARPATGRTAGDKGQLAKVYVQRGVKAYKAKSYFEAAESFRRATDADATNAVAWHHLARSCNHLSRYLPQACEAIAKACELEPMKASYSKLAGEIYAKADRKQEAIQYYRLALRWGGEDPEIRDALDTLEGTKKKSLLGGIFGKIER